jgi:rhamnosyltransferase
MNNTISCVIRTFNEAAFIRDLILNIRSQKNLSAKPDIIVVDSGSTDSTVKILKELKVALIEIEKKEFNYARALNLGIKHTSGNLIVILSAHAIPCEDTWLQKIVSHFKDEKVAGVYCKQIPWPNADWREIVRIEKTFGNSPVCFSPTSKPFNSNLKFSNVASCIKRDVWNKHPFVEMPAAEDHEWADWAIKNGYTIIYEAEMAVYHSHVETRRQAARRMIQIEKAADIRLSRRRTTLSTMRQAIKIIISDIKKAIAYKPSGENKLKLCLQAVCMGFWYFVDFSRKEIH